MGKISEHTEKSAKQISGAPETQSVSQGVRELRPQTRGQVSIELVIIVGFALLMIVGLTILLYEHMNKTYEDVNNNQAGMIARKITDTANEIYYLGTPSITTLKVYMPEGIRSVNMTGREFVFVLDTGSEVISISNVNLTGQLSPGSGLKYIRISALPNKVNITEDVR